MFRALIPVSHDPIEVLADNRILRGIDDQREAVLRITQFATLSALKFLIDAAQFILNALSIAGSRLELSFRPPLRRD